MLTFDDAAEDVYRAYLRGYNRDYYRKNKEARKVTAREQYRQRRESETPEEREAFLARRRELYKQKKKRTGAGEAAKKKCSKKK
jgi:hypothetical protein